MNRLKMLIAPADAQHQIHQQQQQIFDRKLSHRIKRFSSERNLFFAAVYSNNGGHGQTPQPLAPTASQLNLAASDRPQKPAMSKLEKTKSFCRSGLKKCKSLRELYQSRGGKEQPSKPSAAITSDARRLQHLDEFERNYLFSAGKRELVSELRKNFEKPAPAPDDPLVPAKATYRKYDSVDAASSDSDDLRSLEAPQVTAAAKKRPLNAAHSFSVQTTSVSASGLRKSYANDPPPSWTQSAMNLSSMAADGAESSDCSSSITDSTDSAGSSSGSSGSSATTSASAGQRHTAVLRMNLRNGRRPEADTMSMCELSQYPVYMADIADCGQPSLVASRHSECGDSGISIGQPVVASAQIAATTITTTTTGSKLKKYSSVSHIDLELLKTELNDFAGDMAVAAPRRLSSAASAVSLWCPWGLQQQQQQQQQSSSRGGAVRHHRSASSLISATRRKELDLEQKIDLEIKMREGSAKLLAACNNPKNQPRSTLGFGGGQSSSASSPHNTQMLEAAKNLLTSNERMTGYMAELQRRKKERDATTVVAAGSPAGKTGAASSRCTGKVSLSEIRMPLMWRDSDHFKNKGDHRRFAVFCLVKIDTEIHDTSLLCPVDRNSTDISFNDAILFTNVAPDFELKLEVYSVMMEADLSMASTPRKIKNSIHSSISRTVGKRLAANLKDELNNTKISGPKFELIASAALRLDEASDLPHTHDLTLNPATSASATTTAPSSPNPAASLPLFGHFCCRLAVQPDAIETPAISGSLTLHAKGPTRPVEGWARLQAFRLELWDSAEAQAANLAARRTVEVTREAKVRHRPGCAEDVADAVQLYIMEEGTVQEYSLHAESDAGTQRWLAALRRCVREHGQWAHVASAEPMQLAAPVNAGRGGFQRQSMAAAAAATRHRSLYDQVPIMENRQSNCSAPMRPMSNNYHQLLLSGTSTSPTASIHPDQSTPFAVPASVDTSPTLNDFRMRANSSSGRSSSHSSSSISIGSIGSRRSHWPFGGGGHK